MPRLKKFLDDGGTDCWARVDLDNGEPIWIAVHESAARIRRSNAGASGPILFEGSAGDSARVAKALAASRSDDAVPEQLRNAVLRAFTQAALEAGSSSELKARLTTAREAQDSRS
jgi:hypothetical protein